MDRANTPINSLLEQAACIIGRCKEAAGETEPTEGYKGRQTEELIKFANDNGLWIDLSHLNITYMDRGGETDTKKPQTLSASLELSPIIWFQIFLVGDRVSFTKTYVRKKTLAAQKKEEAEKRQLSLGFDEL